MVATVSFIIIDGSGIIKAERSVISKHWKWLRLMLLTMNTNNELGIYCGKPTIYHLDATNMLRLYCVEWFVPLCEECKDSVIVGSEFALRFKDFRRRNEFVVAMDVQNCIPLIWSMSWKGNSGALRWAGDGSLPSLDNIANCKKKGTENRPLSLYTRTDTDREKMARLIEKAKELEEWDHFFPGLTQGISLSETLAMPFLSLVHVRLSFEQLAKWYCNAGTGTTIRIIIWVLCMH